MNNTFRMSEIVLSVPALGIPSRNSDGSISLSGEHITAHVYAVKGNERLLVGRRDFAGMTTSGYGYSLTVIKPEGYNLVVETVDKYGVRDGTSRVFLSSENEAKPANGWHLNKSGTIQSAYISDAIISGHSAELKSKSDDRLMKPVKDEPASNPWVYKGGLNGHVFNPGATKLCLTDDMREAVLDAVRNSDLFQSLVEQVNAQSAAHASTVISLQKGIEQALNDTIRNALQPGGLLFNRGR